MRKLDLVSDCRHCEALCCVATCFDASEDFAMHKPAGVACPHLRGIRCSIHAERHAHGFSGCTIYECYGAGQRATAAHRGEEATVQHAAFLALRELHEALWMLTEAAKLLPSSGSPLAEELARMVDHLDGIGASPLEVLARLNLGAELRPVRPLLYRVGAALGGRAGHTAYSDRESSSHSPAK